MRGIVFLALCALGSMGCSATARDAQSPAKFLGDELAARSFTSPAELRASIRAASQPRSTCMTAILPAEGSPMVRWPNMAPLPQRAGVPGASWQPTAFNGGDALMSISPERMDFGGYQSHLDYSTTNVQVSGIDESHVIKTDGQYIYTVTEQSLFIVDAHHGLTPRVVGSAILPGQAQGMFLEGDHVAVVGQYIDREHLLDDNQQMDQLTFVAVYDVGSRESPELVARHVFEGRFIDGRLLGDMGYFVVTSTAFARPNPAPIVATGKQKGNVAVDDTLAFRQPRTRPNFASVHSLRLSSPKELHSKAVLVGSLSAVYMSPEHLFLADTGAASAADLASRVLPKLVGPFLTEDDKALIERIEAVEDEVFSPLEKRDKVTMVYCDRLEAVDRHDSDELRRRAEVGFAEAFAKAGGSHATAIHRFDIDSLEVSVGETGVISGMPLNQFSFDEYDGVLRVAAIRARDNAVYALDPRRMRKIGELGKLGEGERIHAARFLGERVYLVTYRQVDPFYVIDASNPRKLTKLGELKIPGVSRYLHPWGKDRVLGIGNQDNGMLKISLFDVSNVAAPLELVKLESSELRVEMPNDQGHRALILDREKRLLVVPVSARDHSGVGAVVVEAGASALEQRGLVFNDAAEGTHLRTQMLEGSLYIGSTLYTKSPDLIKATALGDLSEIATVFLK
jgi:inhibitor of cysteine peptidase